MGLQGCWTPELVGIPHSLCFGAPQLGTNLAPLMIDISGGLYMASFGLEHGYEDAVQLLKSERAHKSFYSIVRLVLGHQGYLIPHGFGIYKKQFSLAKPELTSWMGK